MERYKLSEIADIQTGLVLTRKASDGTNEDYKYKRLTLRSVTEECILDVNSFEEYRAFERIDDQFLTQENDIILRLFYPIKTALIKVDHTGLVIPSQLAVVRIKEGSPYLPGYVSTYLSNNRFLSSMIEDAGMSAQKIIRVGSVADLTVPCLSASKQRIIADIAEKQLELVALYKEIAEQETMRTKAIIKEIIGGRV